VDFLCPNDVKEWLDAPLSSPQRAMALFVRALDNTDGVHLHDLKCTKLKLDKGEQCDCLFGVARIIVEALEE